MSECKKTCGNCAGRIESILSKDRCDMTRNTIENYSNTCNHWEPNRETEIVMQKYELKSLRQERDELQAQVAEYEQLNMMQLEAGARAAKLYNEKHGTDIGQLDLARGMVFLMEQNDELRAQVAVLRGALETATDYMYNPFEPDNQCAQYKNIKNILQTTPAEAAERVKKLVEALEEVEKMGTYKNADFTSEDSQEEPWAVIAGNALSEWRRDKCS